jgi:glutaconate CoA-transferase subunit B
MNWTLKQMMAVAVARQIQDEKIYIIGTGLPLIGATLAKNTHAPNVHLIVESGIFEGSPQEVPTSVSDLRLNLNASVLWPEYRYIGFQIHSASSGSIDAGFIGGAQVDPYGNLNSVCIGDYRRPTNRLTGSGGANGIATYCNTIIIMKHEKRRFVEKLDYLTSPGWIDGPEGRKRIGLPADRGPRAVITEFGIMRFGNDKRMYLAEYFPGSTLETIIENTGFKLDTSKAVESEPPSKDIIEILETKIDPMRIMT